MEKTTSINIIIHVLLLTCSALAYNDEYSSSCVRPGGGRAGKAWPDPPCDFTNQAWCTAPGSAYPWHAVRRFVHENQGLMRRMYGDMRQISVLRAEYESNDVLYHGDGADFQLIRDGITKRYRPITESASPPPPSSRGTTASISNKPRSTTTTTTSTTSTSTTTSTTARTTSTVSTPTSTISTTLPKSSSNPTTSSPIPIISSTTAADTGATTDQVVTEDTTEGSTTAAGSTLDTTVMLEEKEVAEIAEASTEEDQQFGEPEDQLPAESEVEYEEEAVEEEIEKQQPTILRRGINACPVKEEVVAPFWANNTRGEILALLNLYPFEQYVHWEKCTDENQQMFCRDGCRCEQQYRLHRLLAYDPRNECRGIFSDWFKFPSCCVCKCYDIPPEFRLTSRSPRRGNTKSKKVGVKSKVAIEEDSIPINGLERREDNGEIRADLQAVVHHDTPPRLGRVYPESATIGPIDAATPHFYYQPPGALPLNRYPRNV